jgi:hypothetical protein
MEGIESGKSTSLKRAWPFGPEESYGPAGYNFNPDHVTEPVASIRSILNQDYVEPQWPLEQPEEICFGSV